MKTSINVPDWLHAQVTAVDPDMAFGELVRDALLIALPVWAKSAAKGQAVLELHAKLRLLEANVAQEQLGRLAAEAAAKAARRRPARSKRGPATPPKRRPPVAATSETTATDTYVRPNRDPRKRGQSPPK